MGFCSQSTIPCFGGDGRSKLPPKKNLYQSAPLYSSHPQPASAENARVVPDPPNENGCDACGEYWPERYFHHVVVMITCTPLTSRGRCVQIRRRRDSNSRCLAAC